MQLADFLAEQQVEFEPVSHPPAFTANKLAKYLRIGGSQVAKGVLLYGSEGFLLAILPATHRIDVKLLSEALGGTIRLARRTRNLVGLSRLRMGRRVAVRCSLRPAPPYWRIHRARSADGV